MWHFVSVGNGSERYMKGSNVTETYGQRESKRSTFDYALLFLLGHYLLTNITNKPAFELPLKEIYNDRVVSCLVIVPACFGDFPVRHVTKIRQLFVRLIKDPVCVFMKAIQ